MATQKEKLDVNQKTTINKKKAKPKSALKRKKSGRFAVSDNPRNKTVNICLTEEENEILVQSAKAAVLTKSDYARKRILGKRIVERSANTQYLQEIKLAMSQLNKLGGLQKELFNNSEIGKKYADDTAENIRLIQIVLVEAKDVYLKIDKLIDENL